MPIAIRTVRGSWSARPWKASAETLPFRLALGGLRKGRRSKLIGAPVKHPRKPSDAAVPARSDDRRGGDARGLEPAEANEFPFLQGFKGQVASIGGSRH